MSVNIDSKMTTAEVGLAKTAAELIAELVELLMVLHKGKQNGDRSTGERADQILITLARLVAAMMDMRAVTNGTVARRVDDAGVAAAPFIPVGQALSAAISAAAPLPPNVKPPLLQELENALAEFRADPIRATYLLKAALAGYSGSLSDERRVRTWFTVQVLSQDGPEVLARYRARIGSEVVELGEMQDDLRYLNLQHHMQLESRRFSLLSNIMKTKHDTAKNSISNIRSAPRESNMSPEQKMALIKLIRDTASQIIRNTR